MGEGLDAGGDVAGDAPDVVGDFVAVEVAGPEGPTDRAHFDGGGGFAGEGDAGGFEGEDDSFADGLGDGEGGPEKGQKDKDAPHGCLCPLYAL